MADDSGSDEVQIVKEDLVSRTPRVKRETPPRVKRDAHSMAAQRVRPPLTLKRSVKVKSGPQAGPARGVKHESENSSKPRASKAKAKAGWDGRMG